MPLSHPENMLLSGKLKPVYGDLDAPFTPIKSAPFWKLKPVYGDLDAPSTPRKSAPFWEYWDLDAPFTPSKSAPGLETETCIWGFPKQIIVCKMDTMCKPSELG